MAAALSKNSDDRRRPSPKTPITPGGKGNCYRHIINQMPPHRVFVETHLGNATVMKEKRPALWNIGIDLDGGALQAARRHFAGDIAATDDMIAREDLIASCGDASCTIDDLAKSGEGRSRAPHYAFLQTDAAAFLEASEFKGDEFVYLDPPYLLSTRKGNRPLYRHEYNESDHVRLLECIVALPCMVCISGYWSALYHEHLGPWRRVHFEVMTRGGTPATEYLWMNYAEPQALHDYGFLGDTFRERERIGRQQRRWINRIEKMPPLEKAAMLKRIAERFGFIEHRRK